MKFRVGIILSLSVIIQFSPAFAAENLSDVQIKQLIIQDSLASYPGNCPCPYNVDRVGHSCGRRSAYSRPGGYSPICYENDVTPQMIRDYRVNHGD